MKSTTAQWLPEAGYGALPGWDSPNTLVVAFANSDLPASPLAELRAAYPQSVVVGCSTAGQFVGSTLRDDSVAAAVMSFDNTRLATKHAAVTIESSHRVGVNLAASLLDEGEDLQAVFVLSDGLAVNGSALVAGLTEVLSGSVSISGGLAGDGSRFEKTWVFADDELRTGHVSVVGFYGNHLVTRHGSRGGWQEFGPERTVTRADGNVLHELDGQPALELYKKYLGDRASGLPATALLFPLGLRLPLSVDDGVVRTVLAIDEDTQTMTFAGDIPTGATVHLTRGTTDVLIDAAEDAGSDASLTGATDTGPGCAIAVSCVGRRMYLGRKSEDELDGLIDGLGDDVENLVGFYSYGELSPARSTTCRLHNQTMTVTTFAESSVESVDG